MSANRTSHAGDPVHRKRTRSGCLPCRSRRRKCDGALPRCRNCEQRGCSCQWGLKASFHPSRSLRLSSCEIVALAVIEKRRVQKSRQPRGSPTIIDETGQILRGYNVLGSGASLSHSNNDHADLKQRESRLGSCSIPSSPRLYNGHDTGTPDIPYEELYHSKSDDTHRLTGTTLSVADLFAPNLRTFGLSPLSNPIRNRSYRETSPSWRRGHIAPSTRSRSTSKLIPDPEPPLPVSNAEKLRLVSAYMQETGTWCETTDSDMHFTVRSLHDIMGSPAFVGAAMALASRQLDYLEGCERQVTLELYQYTIQLLLRQNTAAPDPSVLAACTLLCVYEMMASEVHEWRRHLKGCAGLLQAQKWNGSSPGIIKSCFWAFARIDIWAAFITQNTTLIPTDFWLDDTSCKSVRTTGSIDDYCNLAILTFAKIVNLLALRSHRENECYNSASATSLLSLWDELQEWYQQRPPDVYPLLRDPCSSGKVFPTIIFSRASSICGNTFYHTGCILLLRTGVVTTGTPRSCSRDKVCGLP
ncbi:hypothetical protein ASPSYDRAFT_58899 [Aspergillus sydowii CBS 593.65]|uniref:Zn(2)-C6 fungal-type domain-containing protein n=1 Tax=Aspergillus sydowii CBS 593.65 TaxID=1036612 RepID=A0A1L9TD46_9EURO|nr:uncharacterized protein ASPSYDRAFT_58899 [Aspergillus sydowii CBS 593.65]OJJ57336.1 hypothetical protein ASPSYDRAFT_58899 [Aspergillus sydowii CBS 593.65]